VSFSLTKHATCITHTCVNFNTSCSAVLLALHLICANRCACGYPHAQSSDTGASSAFAAYACKKATLQYVSRRYLRCCGATIAPATAHRYLPHNSDAVYTCRSGNNRTHTCNVQEMLACEACCSYLPLQAVTSQCTWVASLCTVA
jgi:hypothetical protein